MKPIPLRLLACLLLGAASLQAQTVTVTNTSDSGPGSLRNAIAIAAAGSTIDFDIPTNDPGYDAGTGIYTIALSTIGDGTFGPSALLIDKALTIDGGANKITISRGASGSLRLFHINSGGNLTLRNVTVSNGLAQGGSSAWGGAAAGLGGAIVNAGTLTIDRCTLSGNKAQGGSNNAPFTTGGGGLAGNGVAGSPNGGPPNGASGTSSHGQNGGFGGGGSGGATPGAGAAYNGGAGGFGAGGGSNSANGSFFPPSPGRGGFGGGGGGTSTNSSPQIPVNFGGGGFGGGQGNTHGVGGGGGGAGLGGAIFNYGGSVTITSSTLSGNEARGGTGAACCNRPVDGSGFGGAIFNLNGTVTTTFVTIGNNIAPQGGGGIYSLGDNGIATQGGPALRVTSAGAPGAVTLNNTILGESHDGSANLVSDFIQRAHNSGEISGSATGFVSSSGANNLIQTRLAAPNDFAGTALSGDPKLGPLTDNGGVTKTMALLSGSQAINKGVAVAGINTDQRDGDRSLIGVPDIGAYEWDGSSTPSLIVTITEDEDDFTSDPGWGNGTSLREALKNANSLGGEQTITFDSSLAGQTVVLRDAWSSANGYESGSTLAVAGNVTIEGPSTAPGIILEVDAAVERRHFLVNSGASLTLTNLTLTGGKALLPNFNFGGSIWNFGSVTVRGCTFTGNTAGHEGGAIQSWGGSALLAIDNSTFSGNHSHNIAGAIDTGAVTNTFRHVTIANNSATNGHALVIYQNQVTMVNSIIAGNTDDGVGTAAGGSFHTADSKNNILGTGGTAGLVDGVNGNLTGVSNPLLGGLGDYGGPTETVALLTDSPALDHGITLNDIALDQRGIDRPSGGAPDAGAFEARLPEPPTFTMPEISVVTGSDVFDLFAASGASGNGFFSGPGVTDGYFDPTAVGIGEHTITYTVTGHDGVSISVTIIVRVTELPDLVVNITTDLVDPFDEQTSLREAIDYANSLSGAQTVVFDPVLIPDPATIALEGSELVVTGAVTIDGPGADRLTISGSGYSRVFRVAPGATAELRGLTITDGLVDSVGGSGGGLLNEGNLTLVGCVVKNNTAGGTNGGSGGGIYHHGSSLVLRDSSIEGNQAKAGGYGGGLIADSGTATITGCTFSGNQAADPGNGGAIANLGTAFTITNSTFSGNSAANGGAIIHYGNTMTLRYCTVAENTAGYTGGGVERVGRGTNELILINTLVAKNTCGTGPDLYSYFDSTDGAFTSQGHNLIGKGDGAIGLTNGSNNDQVGTIAAPLDPLLVALADNGGPTKTHALLGGSPALHGAAAIAEVITDQRGVGRSGEQGLIGMYYALSGEPTADLINPVSNLEALTPNVTKITPTIDFGAGTESSPGDGSVLDRDGTDGYPFGGIGVDVGQVDNIAALWKGFINVPENATYVFTTRSDDGSVLYIDGNLVVDNNGFHGMQNVPGQVVLSAGPHAIVVAFMEGGGGAGAQLSWEQIDGANAFNRQIIPAARFTSGASNAGPAPDIGAYEASIPAPPVLAVSNIDTEVGNAAIDLFDAVNPQPPGGVFSGVGVTNNMFDPAAAGVGTHTITYTITDANGFTSSVTFTITVDPGPDAASLVVTMVDDTVDDQDGQTSLREALAYAATLSGPQTITFSSSDANGAVNFHDGDFRTMEVSSEFVLSSDVTIEGPGASRLLLDGGYSRRLFRVATGVTAALSGLAFERGFSVEDGGAIQNAGNLTVTACAFRNNQSNSNNGLSGGAISNTGTLVILNSVLRYNNGYNGAGGALANGGTAALANCTISENYSPQGGGISNTGTLTVTNCTVFNNYGDQGGGIRSTGGTFHLANTIVAGNFADSASAPDVEGAITSGGYNLIGNTTGATGLGTTDLQNVNPRLGDLEDTAGGIETYSLLRGSPAINAGSNALALDPVTNDPLTTDGRGTGWDRIAIGVVDIGALEVFMQPVAPATPPRVAQSGGPVSPASVGLFPPGGSFSGTHTSNGIFDPTSLPLGSYNLTYTISNTSGTTLSVNLTVIVSTFAGNVVTTAADTVGGAQQSLRDALAYAAGIDSAQTIIFSSSTVDGAVNFHAAPAKTITLGGQQLEITSEVKIQGPGANLLAVSAAQLSRVFHTAEDVPVEIDGLTIKDGKAPVDEDNGYSRGGGILAEGNLTLTNCIVTTNSAAATAEYYWAEGGGIYADEDLVLSNCTISNNSVSGAYGGAASGAGVYADEDATVTNCTFSSNVIHVGQEGTGEGAGFYGEDEVVMTGCTISGNSITAGDNTDTSAEGAGIYLDDDSEVSDTSITGNFILGGVESDNEGAGANNRGETTFTNVTITNNYINAAASSENGGAGLYINDDAQLTNCTVEGNSITGGASSENSGGGIFTDDDVIIRNSLIAGNTVTGGTDSTNSAGGLRSEYGTDIVNTTISGNTAGGGSTNRGGGIFRYQGYEFDDPLRLINVTIANNSVTGADGTTTSGGGLFVNEWPAEIGNSIVATNTSTGTGPDVSGPLNSQGHNLIGNTTGITSTLETSDLQNVNPRLGPLQDNGGPTKTHALLETAPASPAIDAGDDDIAEDPETNDPLTTDQRGVGFPRSLGNAVDIGAYETTRPARPTLANDELQVLSTDPAFDLATATGPSPTGGVFSGPGVSSGMFNPAAAPLGINRIAYTIIVDGYELTAYAEIAVQQAPAITSPANKTFIADRFGSFTVTASGFPMPWISIEGELPSGLSFYYTSDSIMILGTPFPEAVGTYPLVIRANNGVGDEVVQNFTLSVAALTQVAPVTTPNDIVDAGDGQISLREALALANSGTGPQLITFGPALAGQTITLTEGWNDSADTAALRVANQIVIEGPTTSPGVTIKIGDGVQKRHFYVEGSGDLTLEKLTLSGGNVSDYGGAIWNAGTLTVRACTLTGNYADLQGGAIQSNVGTVLTIENTTISGNTSGDIGSAIATGASAQTFRHLTITNNTGPNGPLYLYETAATMLNTIIAGNSPDGVQTFGAGAFSNESRNNFIGSGGSGGLTNGVDSNFVGLPTARLYLGPLAFNGGPTPTIALMPGSLALNSGINVDGIVTDQRGISREAGGAPDIGAFEDENPNEDPDGDSLTNFQELALNTDPNSIDSDGDGFNDPTEVLAGSNPILASSAPPTSHVARVLGFGPARGLDLSGVFPYAFNVGTPGAAGQAGDANFTADDAPGITVIAPNDIGDWAERAFGNSAADDVLETVYRSIRWANSDNDDSELRTIKVNLAGLTIGRTYKVQLLFAEQGDHNRRFDVIVEGALVADDFNVSDAQGRPVFSHTAAAVVHQFTATDTELNIELSGLELADDSADRNAILNGVTLEDLGIPAPTLTPEAGTYGGGVTVTMINNAPGATLHYTVDGSTPTASSTAYSGPIALTQSATVKAIAVQGTAGVSPVASATYTVVAPLPFWRNLHGLPADGSQDLATPAGDGVANLLKYAFNMAQNAGDLSKPNTSVLSANGTAGLPNISRDLEGRLIVEFVRRTTSSSPGIVYIVESGDDLTQLAPLSLDAAQIVAIDAQWERVTVIDPTVTANRFARVRVQTIE